MGAVVSFEPTTQSLSICLEPIPSLNSSQTSSVKSTYDLEEE